MQPSTPTVPMRPPAPRRIARSSLSRPQTRSSAPSRMLHVLMGHLANQAVPPGIVFEDLLAVAWTTCQQRFPELLENRLNAQQGLIRMTRGGRRLRQRRQLATALAQIYEAPLGYSHRLMEDRQEFSFACRQFLLEGAYHVGPAGDPEPHVLPKGPQTAAKGLLAEFLSQHVEDAGDLVVADAL